MAKKLSGRSSETEQPPAAPYDRRIIVAIGDKGQTGKSTAELQLVDWYLEHPSKPVLRLFDPDTSHRTLFRVFGPEGSAPISDPHRVEQVNWRGHEGEVAIDRVVSVLFEEVPEPPVISVVDGVANQLGDVTRWARSARVFAMGEDVGFRITFLVLMDETMDSVLSARELFKEVGTKADYVIVRNTKKLDRLPWDGSADREDAVMNLGAIEVTLPRFTLDVQRYTDGQIDDQPHSLRQAAVSAPIMFVRNRSLAVMDAIFAEFTKAEALLLPPQLLSR